MPITSLSLQDRQRQVSTFVELFEKEFMAEISYLEETARGNIPARTDASLAMVFNVAYALVSLAPIPGGVLAFMAVPHVLSAAVKLGTVALQNDYSQQAIAMAVEYFTGDVRDQMATIQGGAGDKFSVGEDMPIDTASLSVLARWLGVQLARRYEQVLTERLSTQPDQALMGLARVAARRCLAYLSENPLPKGNFQERTEHLLSGVLVGAAVPWYHRPLNLLKTGERLQGRDEASTLSFTAEKLFTNGAWWMKDASTDVVSCYTQKSTEWIPVSTGLVIKSAVPLGGLPTYGYVTGLVSTPDLGLIPYTGVSLELLDWQQRRLQQPVTIHDVSAYLSSPAVAKARAENRTASLSFNEFLHAQSPGTFPLNAQAVLSSDLSELELRSGNFQGVDFSGSRLAGDVSYASFEHARLFACQATALRAVAGSTVNFSQAELGFSTLSDGTFEGTVTFTQADLTCVDLTNATFGEVDHVGAVWHKAVLTGVHYHGIREAQVAQVTQMAEEQAKQRAELHRVSDQIQALEAKMQPLLAKCEEQSEQHEQWEGLLVAQVNRLKFEAYATEKLEQLSHQHTAHSEAIAHLGTTLTHVREERIAGERVLQDQIDQLGKRVDDLDVRARRQSVSRLKVEKAQQATQQELMELRAILTRLATQGLSSTASPEERETYIEKSAIGKILNEYDKALSQKLQDLMYYVRPDVVDHVPDSMSSAEYVSKVETGEIENKTQPLLSEVDDYLNSDDQVMLLLGDPGAGKSLFSWYSTQSRLQQYQRVLQGLEPGDIPWLPVVIELKNYRLSELTNLLPRYLSDTCHLTPEVAMLYLK